MRSSSALRSDCIALAAGVPRGVSPNPAPDADAGRDQWLVRRAQAGDEAAFAELFQRHRARVFAVALAYLRNPSDAEDVVQETFLRVHRALSGFQGASTFLTWINRIAANLAIDELRRPRRELQEKRLDAEAQGAALERAEAPSNPLLDLGSAALRTDLHHCIERLPAVHRDVIVRRELHGQSYAEMSAHIGVSIGTVMSRLFHARQKLQRLLRETYVEHFGAAPVSDVTALSVVSAVTVVATVSALQPSADHCVQR